MDALRVEYHGAWYRLIGDGEGPWGFEEIEMSEQPGNRPETPPGQGGEQPGHRPDVPPGHDPDPVPPGQQPHPEHPIVEPDEDDEDELEPEPKD